MLLAAKSVNVINCVIGLKGRRKRPFSPSREHEALKWTQLLDSKMFNHAKVPVFPFQFILLVTSGHTLTATSRCSALNGLEIILLEVKQLTVYPSLSRIEGQKTRKSKWKLKYGVHSCLPLYLHAIKANGYGPERCWWCSRPAPI